MDGTNSDGFGTDLFGVSARQADQHSLFGDTDDRLATPAPPSHLPDPENVRRRLHAFLATARAAERMPWDPRRARVVQIMFPNMAKWLPDDEADQLRFEFAREIERLKLAA